MRRVALVGCIALLACACELQEVTVAEPDPFVVVESFLIAGRMPFVALHGSAGAAHLIAPDAIVRFMTPDARFGFARTDPLNCLAPGYGIDPEDFPGGLACYAREQPDTIGAVPLVEPGELYRLQVELPDGSRVDGATRVPEQVVLVTDAGTIAGERCYLEPWTQAELVWHRAEGAAAFIIELRATGVREALEREGIDAEIPEPLILRGLAIGDVDTTIVLPREFGLFDRFTLDPALLIALQQGVPEGVRFEIGIAAIDQNYVNWARGGDFNPSGLIRTPSMFGDAGTGVIGSMTITSLAGSTESPGGPDPDPPPPSPPPCGSALPTS